MWLYVIVLIYSALVIKDFEHFVKKLLAILISYLKCLFLITMFLLPKDLTSVVWQILSLCLEHFLLPG